MGARGLGQIPCGVRRIYELKFLETWALCSIVLHDLQVTHTDWPELAGCTVLPHSHNTGQGMIGKDRGWIESTGSMVPFFGAWSPDSDWLTRKYEADRRDELTDGVNQRLNHNLEARGRPRRPWCICQLCGIPNFSFHGTHDRHVLFCPAKSFFYKQYFTSPGGGDPYARARYFEGWLDTQLLGFGTHNGPQEHSKCLASAMGLGWVNWPTQVKETLPGKCYWKEISTSHEGNMSPQHSI